MSPLWPADAHRAPRPGHPACRTACGTTTPEPAWSSPVAGSAAGRAVSNPFDSDPVARRYAHARPYYHRSALDMATSQLGISHVSLAVDVACRTGLSTRAVLELADHVIAIDASI